MLFCLLQSESLRSAIYSSNWYLTDGVVCRDHGNRTADCVRYRLSLAKYMFIVMERIKRPIGVMAGNLVPLTYETFISVGVKTSFLMKVEYWFGNLIMNFQFVPSLLFWMKKCELLLNTPTIVFTPFEVQFQILKLSKFNKFFQSCFEMEISIFLLNLLHAILIANNLKFLRKDIFFMTIMILNYLLLPLIFY